MITRAQTDGYRANSGGPMSRSRNEIIRCTLLGQHGGPIVCPLSLSLALDFAGRDPVDTAFDLLARAGFATPESLRDPFGPDLRPMVCRSDPKLQALDVAGADPRQALWVAFLLGLCSTVRFDPQRPVLWTRASLTRRLELFDVKEFYS